jgi:RNA polymerase sigma factor (sigma-70 family)
MEEEPVPERPVCALADEQRLIARAQQGDVGDLQLLVENNLNWAVRFLTYQGRVARIQSADLEDALQEAAFWLREAIFNYGRRPGVNCSFRAFARRVLHDRFCDFVRALHRPAEFSEHSEDVLTLLEALERSPEGRCSQTALLADPKDDPVATAQRHETEVRVRSTVAQLTEREQRYCHDLAEGRPLRETAAAVDVPYVTAKRQCRQLKQKLRPVFEPFVAP